MIEGAKPADPYVWKIAALAMGVITNCYLPTNADGRLEIADLDESDADMQAAIDIGVMITREMSRTKARAIKLPDMIAYIEAQRFGDLTGVEACLAMYTSLYISDAEAA